MSLRRPVAPDGLGNLTAITTPDTIDPAILPTVGTPGTVGDATHIPVITTDTLGRVTATSTAAISSGTQRTFAYFAA